MKNVVEIPRAQVIMTFVATCIETTARLLNTSYKEVYERMKRIGLIERFILPHYETLHSESRENLAEVLVECMNNWEDCLYREHNTPDGITTYNKTVNVL